MRSQAVEDNKGWLGPATPEMNGHGNLGFEFHKGANRTPNHHRSTMGKPAPSKWDDAQKWLSGVGLSRGGGGGGEKNHHSRSCKPRNSNADDLRLIASASQREREGEDQYVEYDDGDAAAGRPEVETKNVDCGEPSGSVWRKESINPTAGIRSVCVRDMGTEMTPIGSQEPSRAATPVRATTPVGRSPVTSPVRASHRGETVRMATEVASNKNENIGLGDNSNTKAMNAMEARAMAWDEAERAKFMARYKREEVKIQVWENHEKRKAEMEMKKMEVKAERMKARAEEKLANKLAATKRIAEERRANAEAKLNEMAVRTSERADYIRRSGHLPSSFSFQFPSFSLCW